MKSSFFLTGSTDNTLKIWKSTSGNLSDSPEHIHCAQTELAHDRDINCIDVSPNDKLIVTASRDKTAKVIHSYLPESGTEPTDLLPFEEVKDN